MHLSSVYFTNLSETFNTFKLQIHTVGKPSVTYMGQYHHGVGKRIYILPSSVPTGNFNWNLTELALISIPPATHPATRPPTRPPARNSSEIAGNELNLLTNICRATQGDPKTALKKVQVVFQPENFEVVFQKYFFLNSF